MLKCVIYAVTDEGSNYLANKIPKIKGELQAADIELTVTGIKEALQEIPVQKEGLLIISDSRECIRKLTSAGYYVTGLFHSGNHDKIFEGVSYAVTDVEELEVSSYEEVYRRLAGIPWDILQTERLLVRESRVEDVEAFYRIYGEPSVTDYIEELFQDPDEERAYMESYISQMYGFYGFGMWTVIEKSEKRIIGRAGLDVREGYDLPELGFVIEKAYQQKGYAKEVCHAILDYAAEELLFDKVQALVERKNSSSVHLLEKLGFIYEKEVEERGRVYQLMTKALS